MPKRDAGLSYVAPRHPSRACALQREWEMQELETDMSKEHQKLQRNTVKRCAICAGKFGLIRYYSSRTALCSKRCVEHFKSRCEADSNWLRRLPAA